MACKHCDGSVMARGLCRNHYNQARSQGTLDHYQTKHIPPIERLRSFVRVNESGFWEWTGLKRPDGYGLFWFNRRQRRAHRISYELHKGALKNSDVLCHTCDNRCCVNPEHMFVGTRADNIRDCRSKDRNQFGERHWQAKLSIDDARLILADDSTSQGELARQFGVTQSVISRIKRGRAWTQAMRVSSI